MKRNSFSLTYRLLRRSFSEKAVPVGKHKYTVENFHNR